MTVTYRPQISTTVVEPLLYSKGKTVINGKSRDMMDLLEFISLINHDYYENLIKNIERWRDGDSSCMADDEGIIYMHLNIRLLLFSFAKTINSRKLSNSVER